MCRRLDALDTIIQVFSFHFRLSWITKPRTLCERTVSSTCPSIRKGGSWGVALKKHTRSSLHLLALSFIRFIEAQELTVSNVDWMDAPPFLVRHSEIETSSTNFQRFVSGVGMDKSLIMMTNRIGPSLVPWGTPALTGSQSKNASPIFTRSLWSERKLMIHGIRHRRTPKSTSFLISTLWLIRSKAFEKSKKQRRRCLLGESR